MKNRPDTPGKRGRLHGTLFQRFLLLAGIALCPGARAAWAQCMRWESLGLSGVDAWDIEVENIGSGPRLFVAVDEAVGYWTGTTWGLVGGQGFDNTVSCVGSYGSPGSGAAELYAGGVFAYTSQTQWQVRRIARLVNGAWTDVGGGLPANSGNVYALTRFDDGTGLKLYVGGGFLTASWSGLSSNGIVTWNGTAWAGVGGGLTGGGINAMCVFDDGTGPALFVTGGFTMAGTTPANSIAKWDGSTWTALGSGLEYNGALGGGMDMTVFDDGTGPALYVAGAIDHAGGVAVNGIARWNGANWSALPGTPLNPSFFTRSIAVHDDGTGPALYLGFISAWLGSGLVRGVARWDGQTWTALGGGYKGWVEALASFDDGLGGGPALWAGGQPQGSIGGNLADSALARWYGGCSHRIDSMCFGDGRFAPCPCANYGASEHGCRNSASAQGAHLTSTGTLSPDALVLHTALEPSTSLSLFLQSNALRPVQGPWGDGILCLGGQILRLYAKTASAGTAHAPQPGDPTITQRSAALGDPLGPGSVRLYQVFYRDPVAGWCTPQNFNISNGLRVVW